MLVSLHVRNLVLIDCLDLTLGPGLCALTGETGAGKSILLDALGLAIGARGDSGLARSNDGPASVAAEFAPPAGHSVWRLLTDRGLASGDGLVLRRTIAVDGRSRAFVNDQPVGVALLREIGGLLIEVQGQADQRGLFAANSHRGFLDGFGGLDRLSSEVAAAHGRWRAATAALAAAEAELEAARRDEDYLRHTLDELEALAPDPGEEAELAARRTTLMQGEKLIEGLGAALAELGEGRGVEERLRAAQRHLAQTAGRAPGVLDPAIEALDRAAIETAEALAAVDLAGRDLAPDPARLEAIEQRLFALRAVARKHRVDVGSLAGLRDEFAATLAALDDRGEARARLSAEADAARAAFAAACERLSEARVRAGTALDRRITAELGPLKLANAVFRTRLERLAEDEWTAAGAERVRFEVATLPGAEPGPLARVASGGELSRLLLALRVVLARIGATPTLVFDEVDSGIGGATAAAVGERLARLGEEMQILVVTHSPQVAARAACHFRVIKEDVDGGVRVEVEELAPAARREEVARMLAGARVTDAARAAADSLMRAGAG
ncbi:MAG: DNA repair protein RecN [Alphaproteobacteria bacterium]